MHNDYEIIGYKRYKTVEGDTFDGIALEAYDNEMMSSLIISANPDYCDVLIFDAGIVLRIPVVSDAKTPETLPPWRRGASL